ncbi:MAG: flagellar biosynthesis protein FliQ [Planctomycetes bacterium]|nr:flagellar biosynthesis protein FliQ [Planctomycetota bacterium]
MQFIVDRGREALWVTLQLSLPLLAVGLLVGLGVSLLQAVTQIQEQTLSFIPKIIAVGVALFLLLPWLLTVIVEYTRETIDRIAQAF